MTKQEFAELYLDSMRNQNPSVSFELNSDLEITSAYNDLKYIHHIDNAFIAYNAEPESLDEIITHYVSSATEVYVDQSVNLDKVVPVIKPVGYFNEMNSMTGEVESPAITENYNDQLIIAFGNDSRQSIRYTTKEDLEFLSISRDTLKSVALENLGRFIPEIQRHEDSGVFMLSLNGDFEASFILLTSIWTEENFPVDGELIVGIPNRDMLIITGSNNVYGMSRIKALVADSYTTGVYPISDRLYKWTGKKFELYE